MIRSLLVFALAWFGGTIYMFSLGRESGFGYVAGISATVLAALLSTVGRRSR